MDQPKPDTSWLEQQRALIAEPEQRTVEVRARAEAVAAELNTQLGFGRELNRRYDKFAAEVRMLEYSIYLYRFLQRVMTYKVVDVTDGNIVVLGDGSKFEVTIEVTIGEL